MDYYSFTNPRGMKGWVANSVPAKWSPVNQSISQSNYFIVRPKVDQRAGQLSLPHLGITKTEKIKRKTDEQIN